MTCLDNRRIHTAFPPVPVWSPFELGVATEFVQKLYRKRVYLEIGSYRGGTAWHFATVMDPGALIVMVDLPGGMGGGKPAYKSMLQTRDLLRTKGFEARSVRGSSTDPKTMDGVRKILAGRMVDVLLIDADHGPGAALADWQAYHDLLDGIAIFHDCGVPDGRPNLPARNMAFMHHTRAGFMSAAAGHRYLTVQDDFGTGLIWKSDRSS